jgi:hydroxymethylpyrimidine/phosphomethylpyrimidine kinase
MIARVLAIAGSDSGGGAGIQADIKTITMLGAHAMTAVTAITAQNTLGVTAVHPVPADVVIAQIDAVLADIGVDAIKIGMIGSAAVAHAVADRLESLGVPIVFDPVMVASSGAVLADTETIAAFERLMRFATVTTPNAPELAALSGMAVTTELEQASAVEAVMARTHARAVLAKGGHLRASGDMIGTDADGAPRRVRQEDHVFDALYRSAGIHEISWDHARVESRNDHGTGCTLASGIATGLAQGMALEDAITRARAYVRAAMLAAPGLGAGHGPMGHGLGIRWEK